MCAIVLLVNWCVILLKFMNSNDGDDVQLDWPWIAEWAYAGIFAVAVRFQNQDHFWISHQKNQGHFFIFSKSQKMSPYGQKWCFW